MHRPFRFLPSFPVPSGSTGLRCRVAAVGAVVLVCALAACSVPIATDPVPKAGRIAVTTFEGPPPDGAAVIDRVVGTACRRNPWDGPAKVEDALSELKIAAVSSGADAVYNLDCNTGALNPVEMCFETIHCGGDAVRLSYGAQPR